MWGRRCWSLDVRCHAYICALQHTCVNSVARTDILAAPLPEYMAVTTSHKPHDMRCCICLCCGADLRRRHYFNNTDGLIFVVDSMDRDRIGRAGQEFRSIINDPLMSNSAILVFANKQVWHSGAEEGDTVLEGGVLQYVGRRKKRLRAGSLHRSPGVRQQAGEEWGCAGTGHGR